MLSTVEDAGNKHAMFFVCDMLERLEAWVQAWNALGFLWRAVCVSSILNRLIPYWMAIFWPPWLVRARTSAFVPAAVGGAGAAPAVGAGPGARCRDGVPEGAGEQQYGDANGCGRGPAGTRAGP